MMINSAVRFLDEAARVRPDGIALSDAQETVTYEKMRHDAMSAAMRLMEVGCGPVIVFLPKSVRMVVAFMASLYAGCPYVPVDSTMPAARLQRIINNLHPAAIITSEQLLSCLECDVLGADIITLDALFDLEPDETAIEECLSAVTDADPIYIMYTSGSTGEPKGVTIPHRGVINFALWACETFKWSSETVIANQAPLYFDVSVMDIYGALACAGQLILTPEALFRFPQKLPEFLRDNAVTHIYWVPTVMIHIANSGVLADTELPSLKTVAFAGEVMPNLQLNIWRRALPGRIFANLYGPTETDVCTCYIADREFDDMEPLPVGKPIKNMRVLILDESGNIVPRGETGEICAAGSGVNIGYWNNPELTEKAFVPDPERPFLRERFYRTGDLGYLNKRGEIMFIGRKDGQIKIRGNRVELGEIENAARCISGVKNACALYDSEKQEIFLFVESDEEYQTRRFNRLLRELIPSYMIPQRLVVMQELPQNANNKINRTELKRLMEER